MLGTPWVISFVLTIIYGVRTTGGVGFEFKILALAVLIGFKSSLLGLLALQSFARAVALIPIAACLYTVYPWIATYLGRIGR